GPAHRAQAHAARRPGAGPVHGRCFGSSASLSPSPMTLKASTVTVMARPEKTASHGLLKMLLTPERIMLPQLGVGGCTPRPRKLKLASVRMAVAIHKVDMTEMGPRMLGMMWRRMMRASLTPMARHAW